MQTVFRFPKWFLIIWGGFSLLGAVGIGGFFAYQRGPGNFDRQDAATIEDVAFVLNWCELGTERIERVVHSHVSSRSLTGDHLDAYAIKISHVTIAELTAKKGATPGRWYRGDKVPVVLDDAIDFLAGWLDQSVISWFPSEAELRSEKYYVYPHSIHYHGVRPSAIQLVFVQPTTRTIYYFSGKI